MVSTLIRAAGLSVLALMLLASPPIVRAAPERQGLQGGWAIDDLGNRNFTSSLSLHMATLHESEAGWLRLNLRLQLSVTILSVSPPGAP